MTVTTSPNLQALQQILQDRYSCRAYRPEPLPRELINTMLQVAQRTASWCNTQPWQVHIISGEARNRLSEALYAAAEVDPIGAGEFPFPTQYINQYRERRRTCGFQLYEAVGIERGDRAASRIQMLENFRFFGAPHTALLFTPTDIGTYGAVDVGAYVTNFMNAATALGVGTIAQASVSGFPQIVKEHLGVGDDQMLVCGISFGWPDPEHPINSFRTERAEVNDVVHWHE